MSDYDEPLLGIGALENKILKNSSKNNLSIRYSALDLNDSPPIHKKPSKNSKKSASQAKKKKTLAKSTKRKSQDLAGSKKKAKTKAGGKENFINSDGSDQDSDPEELEKSGIKQKKIQKISQKMKEKLSLSDPENETPEAEEDESASKDPKTEENSSNSVVATKSFKNRKRFTEFLRKFRTKILQKYGEQPENAYVFVDSALEIIDVITRPIAAHLIKNATKISPKYKNSILIKVNEMIELDRKNYLNLNCLLPKFEQGVVLCQRLKLRQQVESAEAGSSSKSSSSKSSKKSKNAKTAISEKSKIQAQIADKTRKYLVLKNLFDWMSSVNTCLKKFETEVVENYNHNLETRTEVMSRKIYAQPGPGTSTLANKTWRDDLDELTVKKYVKFENLRMDFVKILEKVPK